MLRYPVLTLLVVVLLVAFAPLAMANGEPAEINVVGLEAFSPDANRMSLAGYVRWQTYVEYGEWISRLEAVRAVRAQILCRDAMVLKGCRKPL